MRVEQAVQTSYHISQGDVQNKTARNTPNAGGSTDQVDLSVPHRVLVADGDLRPDRVDAVRRLLNEGYYDRPEVRSQIAEAFLKAQDL